jgi:transmembrane sensor
MPAAVASADYSLAGRARKRHRGLPVRGWLALATAAAIALAAIVILPPWGTERPVRLGPVASLSSEVGKARSAQLDDGSHIALGGRSRIDVNFGGSRREIEIQHGEAFFTVQHDRARPFVVRAGGLQVVAVGTAFDVDRRGTRVSVTVQQGVVEVSDLRLDQQESPVPLRIARGWQLIFDGSAGNAPTVRVVRPESADAWRRGRFEYVAEPLAAVIEDLNRYSTEPIVLEDPSLGAMRYSGTIDVSLIDEREIPQRSSGHSVPPERRVVLTQVPLSAPAPS